MTTEPFEHANEADVAEQMTPVDGDPPFETPPVVAQDEANPADVLEQGAVVEPDEEDRPDPS
jgi:hypothetical protein